MFTFLCEKVMRENVHTYLYSCVCISILNSNYTNKDPKLNSNYISDIGFHLPQNNNAKY